MDRLADIVFTQEKLQRDVYGYDFSKMTITELVEYWLLNLHSINKELCEMTDALGGDQNGSAAWKPWKAAHLTYEKLCIADLSRKERDALYTEWADCFHFLINFAIAMGMGANEIYDYYMKKASENVNRQRCGY